MEIPRFCVWGGCAHLFNKFFIIYLYTLLFVIKLYYLSCVPVSRLSTILICDNTLWSNYTFKVLSKSQHFSKPGSSVKCKFQMKNHLWILGYNRCVIIKLFLKMTLMWMFFHNPCEKGHYILKKFPWKKTKEKMAASCGIPALTMLLCKFPCRHFWMW